MSAMASDSIRIKLENRIKDGRVKGFLPGSLQVPVAKEDNNQTNIACYSHSPQRLERDEDENIVHLKL
jgi:hypothetical protein